MSNIEKEEGHKRARAREVITTLAELRKRLLYNGDLSDESEKLYNQIEQTLHQAIGELYGWTAEEEAEEATTNTDTEGNQRGDHREPQDRDDH